MLRPGYTTDRDLAKKGETSARRAVSRSSSCLGEHCGSLRNACYDYSWSCNGIEYIYSDHTHASKYSSH